MARIESPCVGICSTTLGDTICRGCKRHSDEILNWGGAEADFRETVMQRIEDITVHVVGQYFKLLDKDQLEQQLNKRRIRYTKRFNALCWIVDLLRAGASRIKNLDAYGLELTTEAFHQEKNIIQDDPVNSTVATAYTSDLLEQLYQKINRTILEETDRLICEKP